LVQSRQNKLARDIDRINTQIRNNQISASQGKRRILFKKAEIDQLEHYKRSRRTPTGRLSPPPRTAAPVRSKKGPANKYNPAASDKVPGATGPADFSVPQPKYKRSSPNVRNQRMPEGGSVAQRLSLIEEDRAGMTSKSNQRPSGSRPPQQTRDTSVNARGLREADYYNRLVSNYKARTGRSPPSQALTSYRAGASAMWKRSTPLPTKATPRPPSPSQQAKSAAKKAGSGLLDRFKSAASKSSSRSSTQTLVANERDAPTQTLVANERNAPPKKTLKDNPHGKSYGTSYSFAEKARSGGKAKKYNGVYYGPSSPTKVSAWSKWNSANLSGYGGMPQSALIRRKAEMNRQTTMMRMRAGAKLDLNQPIMQKRTQMRSWETYGRPAEVDAIKNMVPMMIGLDKFPELTPEGNAMMAQVMQTNNDERKMQIVANKLATDLVNKSGYFVKKYNVEVDPLQKKVKVSEMSGLAGGLTKTRNSMQRLL
jgi:hypothetical protein